MKKLIYFLAAFLIAALLLPTGHLFAQMPVRKPLPQVPITYPGDTDQTINRRAQWIEGARKEGTVVVWGSLTQGECNDIAAEFNKIYPFIKVDYWRATGDEEAAKLEAEYANNRYSVDFLWGGEPQNYARWAKMGIIDKFVDLIPGIDRLDKRMYGKRGDWIIPGFAPKIMQYNTKLLSAAAAPKNWEDLVDSKWKEQLGIEIDPDNWATFALCEGGWGVEKTESFLSKLKGQKPKFIQGGSAAHSLLIAGEFKVLVMGNLRHVLVSQKKNAPVEWVRVNPVLVTGMPFIMPKKGPHPNAVRLFLEWIFSPRGRLAWAEVTQNYVPGAPTPIAKLLEGLTLIYRNEEVIQKGAESGLNKRFGKLLFDIEN